MRAEDMPVSFIVESNRGGIALTICACGVLLICGMSQAHLDGCQAIAEWEAEQDAKRVTP